MPGTRSWAPIYRTSGQLPRLRMLANNVKRGPVTRKDGCPGVLEVIIRREYQPWWLLLMREAGVKKMDMVVKQRSSVAFYLEHEHLGDDVIGAQTSTVQYGESNHKAWQSTRAWTRLLILYM